MKKHFIWKLLFLVLIVSYCKRKEKEKKFVEVRIDAKNIKKAIAYAKKFKEEFDKLKPKPGCESLPQNPEKRINEEYLKPVSERLDKFIKNLAAKKGSSGYVKIMAPNFEKIIKDMRKIKRKSTNKLMSSCKKGLLFYKDKAITIKKIDKFESLANKIMDLMET